MTKVKLQPNKLSSKKNIGVFYKGGCGGHFLYYFLLASGTYNAFYTRPTIRKVDNIEKIKTQFYLQFSKNQPWLKYEQWPDKNSHNDTKQLFHFCNPKESELEKDYVKVCPFIKDHKTWFRSVLYKKTNIFRDKKITFSFIKSTYQELLQNFKNGFFNKKINNCDYYLEITEFVNKLEQRKKLCKFLKIPHTQLMEEFVSHYNYCHKKLKNKTSW